MKAYLSFLLANARFLAFGFLLQFASSLGQTYFIGAFGGVWRTEFDLSHRNFGVIYAAATLAGQMLR